MSLLSLVVGGAWLFGMIFIGAFRSEKHIVLVLSMVWGGGALTLASLFILGAIGEKYSPVGWVGANDNRDPNAPAKVEPVVVADTSLSPRTSELYGRPVPAPMTKYVS